MEFVKILEMLKTSISALVCKESIAKFSIWLADWVKKLYDNTPNKIEATNTMGIIINVLSSLDNLNVKLTRRRLFY